MAASPVFTIETPTKGPVEGTTSQEREEEEEEEEEGEVVSEEEEGPAEEELSEEEEEGVEGPDEDGLDEVRTRPPPPHPSAALPFLWHCLGHCARLGFVSRLKPHSFQDL